MSEQAPNQLTVYTVPSYTEGPGRPPLDRPYDQIVGVADSEGNVAWAQPGRTDTYDPQAVQRHDLPSDPTHSERVRDYWQDYYANEEPCPTGNCHDFARRVATGEGGTQRPDFIISQGETVVSLGLREHAVIGGLDKDGKPHGHHSASGLGHREDRVLERLTGRGPLGLTKIDDVLHRYRYFKPGDDLQNKPVVQEEVYMFANRQPAPLPNTHDRDL